MTTKTKPTTKALDRQIDAIYRARCQGMQIAVTRISALFDDARRRLLAGETETQVGDAMVAFVASDTPTRLDRGML